jgi:hypothetical protein
MIRFPWRKRAILAAGALLLATGVASCGGGGGGDVTARPIDDSVLGTMAVYEVDLPGDFAGFVRIEGSGFKDNEQSAAEHFDPVDEAQDLERFAQEREYVRRYGPSEAGGATSAGAVNFVSAVRLFKDASGASGYLTDELTDIEGSVGKESGGITINAVERLKVGGIGDEAAGVRMTMTVAGGGSERPEYETLVFFRRGRLLVSLAAIRGDEVDFKSDLETLARSLNERIQIVLKEAPAVSPAPAGSPMPSASPAAAGSATPAH